MEDYDYLDESQPKRSSFDIVWNVLTVLVLLTVLCVALVFLVIFSNPNSGLNPYQPPTLIPTISLPTSTSTALIVLDPTWTPTAPPALTDTPTQQPTFTSSPTIRSSPSETPYIIFTPSPGTTGTEVVGGKPFIVGPGTPVATSSLAFHPEEGCNWLGVSGQVFDLSGAPISGQQVRIGGTLSGTSIEMLSLTGLTTAYGSIGFYEFYLGDKLIASKGTLWVQLLDQAGIAMSDKINFDTYGDCEKNLIFVNFKQVR